MMKKATFHILISLTLSFACIKANDDSECREIAEGLFKAVKIRDILVFSRAVQELDKKEYNREKIARIFCYFNEGGDTLLHAAIKESTYDIVKKIIQYFVSECRCDINTESAFGTTAIKTAVMSNNSKAIEALFRARAAVGAIDEVGMSLLHWAAYHDADQAASALVAIGQYIKCRHLLLSYKDMYGRTPIDLAIQRGSVKTLETLLRFKRFEGYFVNVRKSMFKAKLISLAKEHNKFEIANLLKTWEPVEVR